MIYNLPTIDQVAERVIAILANGDHEDAHWQEDELLRVLIRAAARGHDVSGQAAAVVPLLDAPRTRWYA